MNDDIQAITERVKEQSKFVQTLTSEISKVIVGQKYMVERLLVGLLSKAAVSCRGGDDVVQDAEVGADGTLSRRGPARDYSVAEQALAETRVNGFRGSAVESTRLSGPDVG